MRAGLLVFLKVIYERMNVRHWVLEVALQFSEVAVRLAFVLPALDEHFLTYNKVSLAHFLDRFESTQDSFLV